jgi:site-specific DNA recombinase
MGQNKISVGSAQKQKCVIYARVSSKEQEKEGFSIPAQTKLLQNYAVQNRMEIAKVFVDVETAKKTGRPSFIEMVAFLNKWRKISGENQCVLLVEKTDRLYRNLKDWVTIDGLDVAIHLVKENVILSKDSRSSEKFMHGIKVLMAKNFIDNLSEETRKGMQEKAEQGIWPSYAPIGYLNELGKQGKKVIVVDRSVSSVIRRIYELYASGRHSLASIAQLISDESYFEAGKKKFGKRLVHKILTNPIYSGSFNWNGVLYEGNHEAIVSKELFDQVQDMLSGKGRCPSSPQKHHFAFQGMVVCGHCGCAMVAEIKKGKYIYYHCTGNKGKCPGKYAREEEMDRQFLASLEAIRIDEDVIEWVITALKESQKDEKRYFEERLQSLQEQHMKLKNRLDAMYIDKLDGKISQEFYDAKTAEWRMDQDILKEKIEQHQQANRIYIDEGIRLLELSQSAVSLYMRQSMEEKRRLLNYVHSNSTWKDGQLIPNYRKPFDLLAVTNVAYKQKQAASLEKSDLCSLWLPFTDSNHGQGD